MKKYNFLAIILLVIALASCKNDGIYGVRDAVATDAITVDNATFYERYPFTTTSVSAGGKIEIRLKLADGSPRTIKEITRVAASSVNRAINPTAVQVATGLYNTAPISASGKSVTFTTTVAEYLTKKSLTSLPLNGTAFYDLQFIFMITLDNGDTIIPLETRVRPSA